MTRLTYKERAEENLKFDPMFYKRRGKAGGSVSGIKKGLAGMSEEKRRAISAKGVATRLARKQSEKI